MKLKKIISLLLVVVIVLSMTGCKSAQATPASGQKSEKAQSDKTVEVLSVGITKDIEPRTLTSESGQFGRMNYNAFCAGTLLTRDANNEIKPNLMTAWEIGKDGKSIVATFATDKGITWHDGVPLTIDDVIFTIDFMNNKLKSGYLSKIDSVEKLSDTQLKLNLKDSSAYFTIGNSAVFVRLYPKHIWEKITDPLNYSGEEATIGCGPYKLVSIDKEARVMTYETVGDSFLGKKLTVKKVIVRTYDSQDALVMALVRGDVDAMNDYSNPISPTMLPSISNIKGLDPGKSINQGLFQILFGFNKQPTDDVNFRKAVRLALDYKLLASTIGGEDGKIPGAGIIPPSSIGHDASIPALKQDIEAAKTALETAGYKDINGDGIREKPDGSVMNVLVTPQYNTTKSALYLRISEIVIENLKQIGVKATLDEESVRNSDAETKLRKEGKYEIYVGYSTQGVAYYKTAFLYMFNDPISMWGSCNIPAFNEAYNKLLTASGSDEYVSTLKKLQQLNVEQCIGVPLCWDTAYYPYRTDKFEGWVNYPGWGVINAETWYNLHPKNK